MLHRIPCFIPRKWLAFPWDSLQVVINKEIKNYYAKYGRAEGSAILIEGVTARLQIYNSNFWMRDDLDLKTSPNLKDYYPFLIPCIDCNRQCKPRKSETKG